MALLLMDVVAEPQDHPGFRAAWRACPSTTALKHLDVDAPQLFRGLYEQEMSGGCDCLCFESWLPGRGIACWCQRTLVCCHVQLANLSDLALPAGLWDAKPVQCSAGDFLPGDYSSWKAWRDSLPTVAHI